MPILKKTLVVLLFSSAVSAQNLQEPPVSATAPTGQAELGQAPANQPAPSSREKPAFIVDSLSTALRSGPGNEYRTISTVRAGETVTFIGDNPANGFIKIRDNSGTEGWLSGEYITYDASPKASLEGLKQQLSQQEMIAAQFEQERQAFQQQLTQLQTERDDAVKAAELARQTTAQLTARLAEENPDLLQNKMVIGAGLIAAGLLFGLILPAVMPRRRRNDRWM